MIHRSELHFDRDYTIMPNTWARDVRLTRKARGLLAELLSHSVGWSISLDYLVASGAEGRDAVRSAIKELEDAGYLTRSRLRDAAGRLRGAQYALADPHQSSGIPASEKPTQADRPRKKTSTEKKSSKYNVAPSGVSGKLASEKQIAFLRDMHATLGTLDSEQIERINSMSYTEADGEIKRLDSDFQKARETQRRVKRKPQRPKASIEEQEAEWCRKHGVTVQEYRDMKAYDPQALEIVKRRGVVAA